MKISVNRLKTYIKDADLIDWVEVWDRFTTRVAEVEGIEIKGQDLKNIVVSEIIECEPHSKKENYKILKVDNGKEILSILCGAPNVRKGLKTPLVNVGGMVQGYEITSKEIAGVNSQGMLLSMSELGLGEDRSGIMELPEYYEVGTDLKELLPIEDIIVEIDNKSLTNRPDLWGHYGIAREIAAITNQELLPLEIVEIENNKKDLDIKILSEYCLRYIGLEISNIIVQTSPLWLQVFLHYIEMRPISLTVDLTNYLMVELGTPMHAFDSKKVSNIEIGLANDQDKFTTLDGIERTLSENTLMIKNNNEYYAIAGVMGGLASEVEGNTNSIVLESACFDSTSVRKTATYLGLRTEASSRYEKSLDPNLSELATKRYVKLLKDIDSNIQITSNLTDVYPNKLKSPTIKLTKEKLSLYMGIDLDEEIVVKILESLEFKVTNKKDCYEVVVPTFRATKDISIEEDLIEEVSRIYGYENIKPVPLKVDLTANMSETEFDVGYNLKRLLATKYSLNEVHSYLWNNTNTLNKLGIKKDNVKVIGRTENNVLRDDLLLSLIDIAIENSKYQDNYGIFEIGTVIKSNENHKNLGVLLVDDFKAIKKTYYNLKEIIYSIFKIFKNIEVEFKKIELDDIYHNPLSLGIFVDDILYGYIGVVDQVVIKRKNIVYANIDFEKFLILEKKVNTYETISKYPTVTLDYTIITPKEITYEKMKKILDEYLNSLSKGYEYLGVYETDTDKKYNIRYTVGSYERTLTSEDLEEFKNNFINHIRNNELEIVE